MKSLSNRVISLGFVAILLAGCQRVDVVDVPVTNSANSHKIANVNNGYDTAWADHGSEWTAFAVNINASCAPSLSGLGNNSVQATVPLFVSTESHGRLVYDDNNQQILLSPFYRKDGNGKIHAISRVVIKYAGSPEKSFERDSVVSAWTGYSDEISDVVDVRNGYCRVTQQIIPAAGFISAKLWQDGVGNDMLHPSVVHAFGNPLPGEDSAPGDLSSVMKGENSGSEFGRAHRPDFYDPIRPQQGGFGPVVH